METKPYPMLEGMASRKLDRQYSVLARCATHREGAERASKYRHYIAAEHVHGNHLCAVCLRNDGSSPKAGLAITNASIRDGICARSDMSVFELTETELENAEPLRDDDDQLLGDQ